MDFALNTILSGIFTFLLSFSWFLSKKLANISNFAYIATFGLSMYFYLLFWTRSWSILAILIWLLIVLLMSFIQSVLTYIYDSNWYIWLGILWIYFSQSLVLSFPDFTGGSNGIYFVSNQLNLQSCFMAIVSTLLVSVFIFWFKYTKGFLKLKAYGQNPALFQAITGESFNLVFTVFLFVNFLSMFSGFILASMSGYADNSIFSINTVIIAIFATEIFSKTDFTSFLLGFVLVMSLQTTFDLISQTQSQAFFLKNIIFGLSLLFCFYRSAKLNTKNYAS